MTDFVDGNVVPNISLDHDTKENDISDSKSDAGSLYVSAHAIVQAIVHPIVAKWKANGGDDHEIWHDKHL